MIDPKYKKIIILQVFVWTVFFFISALIYKNHFQLKIDSDFSIKYSITVAIFFITNIWLIIRFSRPVVENMEEKLYHQEKVFKREKNDLEIENRMYKIMFNSIDEPIMVITNDLNVFFYNLKIVQLFGLKDPSATFPLLELTRNFEFQNFLKQAVQTSKVSELDFFSFQNEQASDRKYYNLKVIPIKFSGHYIVLFHDSTERKFADQMREDFISNFSHEIRTPLTILSGQIQHLRGTLSPNSINHETESVLSKIDNNTRRLTNLFDDMLSLTSIEKKRDLNIEEFDLEPMLDFITTDLKTKYSSKQISFEINLIQKNIKADYNFFEQVLINLLDNAIKYSPNQAHIKVEARLELQQFIISIKDNGIGIPDSFKPRIFERFFRVDASRSSEISGTGLGLAIVKHIIQKHNGKIRVQSEINQGTTFTIQLPN